MEIDFENPEVQQAVQAKINEATQGLANKNAELLGKINESKSKMEEMQANMKKFEGIDMEEVTKMQKLFEESEEARMIKDGRLDEVIQRKTEAKIKDATTRAEQLAQEREQLFEQNNSLKAKYDNLVVSQRVSAAAAQAGIVPEAIEDVLSRASRTFKVGEDGNLEARDGSGKLLVNKKGENLTPAEWVKNLKEVAPHYFPQSQSGGHNYTPSQAEASLLDVAKSGDMAAYRKARAKAKAS
jgi:hypothetical protein